MSSRQKREDGAGVFDTSQPRARTATASWWNWFAPSLTLARPKATESATRRRSTLDFACALGRRRRQRHGDLGRLGHERDLRLAEFVEVGRQHGLRGGGARHAALNAENLHAPGTFIMKLTTFGRLSWLRERAETLISMAGFM